MSRTGQVVGVEIAAVLRRTEDVLLGLHGVVDLWAICFAVERCSCRQALVMSAHCSSMRLDLSIFIINGFLEAHLKVRFSLTRVRAVFPIRMGLLVLLPLS